jgi:hypothetical protein
MAAGTPVFGTPGFIATDLGTDWVCQSQDSASNQDHAEAVGGDGDVIAEVKYNTRLEGSETYVYNGSATDFGSASTGALAADGCLPGKYQATAAVIITKVEINYAPCASGQRETVTFTYRSGLDADSSVYAPTLTAVLKTKQEGEGVPQDLLTNANAADSKCASATYAIECQEGRTLSAAGEHLAGATYKGQESLNLSYVGLPSLTTTGWVVTSDQSATGGGGKTNTAYGTFSITAAKKLTRAA